GDPVPVLAGAAAALLLTAAAVAVAVVIRARARALAESYRRAASMSPGGRVVVMPAPSRWPGPARCPGGSPPCSPRPRAASWPCWPSSLS
ncbi:MAG: hypothetical protein ACRDPF_35935, partial [Streptosporangiaceae bacterium]